jgi:hypothetical protein
VSGHRPWLAQSEPLQARRIQPLVPSVAAIDGPSPVGGAGRCVAARGHPTTRLRLPEATVLVEFAWTEFRSGESGAASGTGDITGESTYGFGLQVADELPLLDQRASSVAVQGERDPGTQRGASVAVTGLLRFPPGDACVATSLFRRADAPMTLPTAPSGELPRQSNLGDEDPATLQPAGLEVVHGVVDGVERVGARA